jgi:hypothetical protein
MKADEELKASGRVCANLTPAIKNASSEMEQKAVLEVSNDYLAPRTSAPAWSGETLAAITPTAKKGGETAGTLNRCL